MERKYRWWNTSIRGLKEMCAELQLACTKEQKGKSMPVSSGWRMLQACDS